MKLIEFKSTDVHNRESLVFINSEFVESIYPIPGFNRIGIGLASGKSFEVNHTLEEVKEKLGINKRIARVIT